MVPVDVVAQLGERAEKEMTNRTRSNHTGKACHHRCVLDMPTSRPHLVSLVGCVAANKVCLIPINESTRKPTDDLVEETVLLATKLGGFRQRHGRKSSELGKKSGQS